ncbi:MAG: substrate-binding domain-containing protein [Lachnospiraceae bacterium]|nr:substrate-binding domain-containing protein [Lachnospiraceae bacterium]
MKLKKVTALALAAAMALSLAACGSNQGSAPAATGSGETSGSETGTETPDGASGDKMVVAYIPKERNEAFWQAVESGAQSAADTLGVELKMYGDPAGSNTASNQATYVETATQSGADAIAFAALDADSTDAALQAAMSKGIAVVGFDSDPGPEARNWFVNQADPEGIAVACLDDLVKNLGEKFSKESPAVVYLVSTNPTTPNQNTWIEYIKKAYFSDYEIQYAADGVSIDFDACKENTKSKTFTVNDAYACLDVKVNPDSDIIYAGDGSGNDIIPGVVAAHPEINALVSLTTNVIDTCAQTIKDLNMQETCIFNGIAVPASCESYLTDGIMTEVILWQAYDLGYLAVEAAVAAAKGEISGDTYVSTLSGTTQVEGVSTYPEEGHKINGTEIILGDPATFTLDSISAWKE